MKSTWFSRREHHVFAQCLQDAHRGSRSTWEAFSDFLTLAYLSLSQAAHKLRTGTLDPAKETEYERVRKTYKHPEKFSEAFAHVVLALEVSAYDFIGTVAGELEILSNWHGQFFTPQCVCDLMAQMTMGETQPDPERRLKICEPACGAGAMCIAVANALKARNFFPWNYWITAVDVDPKMAMATSRLTGLKYPLELPSNHETPLLHPLLDAGVSPLRRAPASPSPAVDPRSNRRKTHDLVAAPRF